MPVSFKRGLQFFIFSNIFIALCAIVMVCQTYWLILHSGPNPWFISFVFFATITSYSFHWHLTPDAAGESSRLRWLKKYRKWHRILFVVGCIGVFISVIPLMEHWKWLLLSALITFLYSAPMIPHPLFRQLRKIALGKTIFLAFVWMYVTTVLPLLIEPAGWQSEYTVFAIGRFFLIYAICIIFDYRDREYDRSIGIRSLITWLSDKWVNILFIGSLVLFFLFTLALINYDHRRLDILFLLIPGVITAAIYKYARVNRSDLLFYFILDGLMALSGFLMLIERLKYL